MSRTAREGLPLGDIEKDGVVNQLDLFEEKKDLYILPVRIMIEFSCNDPDCAGHKMSI